VTIELHDRSRGMSRPVALVTGASAGIGVAFAHELAARGYDLVLVARRRERLDALAATLTATHAEMRAHVLVTDLAAAGATDDIAAHLSRDGIAVDLLVNNAGFGWNGAFLDGDPANAQGQIAVNIAALVGLTYAFVPGMVARKHGGIINVASTAAFQPVPYMAVYGATKAFVLSFSEALHEELLGSGVAVVALCPGATETEFFQVAGEGAQMGPRRTVADVVRTGLRALDANGAIAIDGAANRALATTVGFMPRGLVRKMGARMMKPA
jgi:short-subunit dehydrogenase